LPSSLNRRLGGRFALALVVCALAVTAVVLFGLRRHAETQARARLEPQGVAIAEVLLRKARSIAGLVQSLAATAAIEDDDQRLRRLIPALLADGDANSLIAGGGLWPEPFARDPARQRDCLFWGRQADGRLRFFDDYNHPDKPDYHLDAWYVPARTLAPGHCIWSQGYTDPHSHEPMVTCSAPYFRDGRLAGVVTVDVRLSGLDRLARSLEQPLGGCLRITDRDGHLLSEPRQPLLDDGNPHLRPLHAAFAAGGAAEVRPGSRLYQQIGAQVPVHPGQLIELPHDPRLGKAALVQHLVVPEVGWHLFLAIPRDRALAEAHRFTLVIALTLAGLVVVGLLTAYLATQALVTKPLMRLAAGIRQSGDRPLAGDVASLAQRGDELGAVVCWIVARDAQLLEARRAAEAAAAAKASFLANMSHEIRTPLNGMLGMAQLLQHTRLDGEQEDLVRTILGSGGSLLSVINDILDFSGLDAGARTLVIEPFDLRGMVHDIVDLFRAQPNERLVDLLVDIDPTVPQRLLGDPARVRQIITNLLGNARKFTERGHVLVHARHVDGNLELAVADTGVGIP
jgi:signal transduction histidine kinase